MSKRNRIIAFSVAIVLTFTLFALNGAEAVVPFSDVDNVPEKEKIISLQERGYVSGTGDNRFVPQARITAAESIQLIVNSMGLNLNAVKFFKEPKATDYFSKADDDAWYAQALIIAAVNSMDLGRDIDLSQEWTREKFTYYLTRTMENHYNLPMLNIKPADIKDQELMTAEYSGAVQRAIIYGIVSLDENGNFFPMDKITRAEAAEQVYNALEYLKEHSVSNDNGGTVN